MRVALPLAVWLVAFAPGTAHADPPEPPAPIELRVDEERTLDVPGGEEIVVASADGIEVTPLSGSRAVVRAVRNDGRAVLLIRTAGGYETITVRSVASPRPVASVASEASPYIPSLAVGGDYHVTGAPDISQTTLYHWGSWLQSTPAVEAEGYVGVLGEARGRFGVSDLLASVRATRWDATLGDLDLQLLGTAEGFQGSAVTLRGGGASVAPGPLPFRIGIVGGARRDPTCCTYFDPDSMWMGALTAGWYAGRGAWADVLGGVFSQEGGAIQPLVRLRGGIRSERVFLEAMVNQAGPGTGASAASRIALTPTLSWYGSGGASTARFVRVMSSRPYPEQAGGSTGLSWRVSKARLEAGFFGWGRGGDSPSRVLGVRADGTWFPRRDFSLHAGYRRTASVSSGIGYDSDTVSAGVWAQPVRALSVDGSFYADFTRDTPPAIGAFAGADLRFSARWRMRATYRFQTQSRADVDDVLHGGTLGAFFESDHVRFGADTRVDQRFKDGVPSTLLYASAQASFRVRRFLEFGVGAYVGTTLPAQATPWGATAFWTLRPTELGRRGGGLGLRGRLVGDVYLDTNENGQRDEGEAGLPDIPVTIDESREILTDDDGRFSARNLPSGDYSVRIDRGNYHALGPTVRTVRVAPLKSTDAGLGLTWGSSINGLLYVDVHEDGAYDNGDPGVSAEYVVLRDERGVVVRSTPATDGRFGFDGLAPGIYTVEVDAFGLPAGYRPLDALTQEVLIDQSRSYPVHIRLDPARTIGGVVWEDVDKDGVGGGKKDLGIGGAEVYLSTGEVAHTGPDGSFLFSDLPPGAYAVRTELSTEAKVVVLPVEPKEVLDISFVLPKGTRPPEQNVRVAPKPADSVAGLVLEAPMSVLPQGVELQVTATAVLSNGETREVTTRANWSSSDMGILTVSPEGKVSGHAAGTAGATAEWKGGVGDPLTFEVLGTPLDRITVSPVGLRLNPGNTADLRVDVVDRSGRGGEATPVAVWEVADTRVARVDAGQLRALRDGITTVRARIGDTWSAPLEIQVITAEVTALSIENLPARMPQGSTVQLKATGYDTRLEVQNVTESVTWSSSDPNVVQVEADGRIIAVGRGTAQITASIGSLFTRSRTVFVTNTPPLALEVVPPGMTLSVYDVQRFRATATFEDGTKGAVTTVVEWIVEGTAAMVRPDGTVIPREAGTVKVRARYLGVESAPVVVTITP